MKIIIHAGWHKTGSTAIQWFLNENRDRLLREAGILYPETGLLTVAHHLVAWSLHDPMESAWANSIGFSEQAETLLPKILQEAVAAGAKTCLLSSEEFAWWGKISPQRLAEIFSGHEVELVVYLRRQDQLAESFWAQGLKQGARMPDFPVFLQSIRNWFDFSEFCQWWEKSFPDSINVRIFNRSEFPDGDVVKDFARFLGLPWDQEWKVLTEDLNTSISAHAARAIFEWNASNSPRYDEVEQRRLVNFLRTIDIAEAESSQSLLRFPQRLKFLQGFEQSNQTLFQKWCNRNDNPFALSEREVQRLQDEDAAESEEERCDAIQIRLRALTLRKETAQAPTGEQAADLLRNEGVQYLNLGIWKKALHRFAAAYALRPSGLFIRLSLARVLVELGRLSAAKGHLEALAQGEDFSGKEPLLGDLIKRCEFECIEATAKSENSVTQVDPINGSTQLPEKITLKGRVDSFTMDKITGWARYLEVSDVVELELLVNGCSVGTFKANKFRGDLKKIREDGCFAFVIEPQASKGSILSCVPTAARVLIRDKYTGGMLPGGESIWQGTAQVGQRGIVSKDGENLRLNKGTLVIPLGERSQEWRTKKTGLTANFIEKCTNDGHQVAIAYGTLLGAMRSGKMIENDDDIDLMFLSRKFDMLEAVDDFHDFLDYCGTTGHKCNKISNGQAQINNPDGLGVDVFLAWIFDNRLQLTFTVRNGAFSEQVIPFKPMQLEGISLLAPASPEHVLENIYGPSWKTPDPAFQWDRPKDVTSFFAPIHNYNRGANREYWNSYYGKKGSINPPSFPSQFAIFVMGLRRRSETLIELGCGNGRDSLFFASQGLNVFAIDYSQSAIALNQSFAKENGLHTRLVFSCLDVSDLHEVSKFVVQVKSDAQSGPICLYSRFFLHAVDESTQGAILILISRLLIRQGDYAALEFRTESDQCRQKVTAEHYRRFVEPSKVVEDAAGLGLRCTYRVEGQGYANFGEDDAWVCRLVLER